MPQSHFSVSTDFPPFALAFLDEHTLVLGGGGGSSKSGVKNQAIARLEGQLLRPAATKLMQEDEDAPMSLVVDPKTGRIAYGANQASKFMSKGENDNLRTLHFENGLLQDGPTCQALESQDDSNYQRTAALSRDGSLLAVGNTDGTLATFTLPHLQPLSLRHTFRDDEVYDVDFNDDGSKLAGTSSRSVQLWSTLEKDLSGPAPKVLQIIDAPGPNYAFRAARFGRKATSDRLYTLVNSSAKSKNKTAARKAFLSVWRASDCSLHQTRVVASRPITVMDVSPDGLHLALGGSDLSVSVWNAQTLLPLRLVRAAHDFPATALRFSPSGQMVISTSADNTLRVIPVEKTWAVDSTLWTALLILLFAIIMAWATRR